MNVSHLLTTATPSQIALARAWIFDCTWQDLDSEDTLTDAQAVAGVQRHYCGGWPAFITENNFAS